MTKKEQIGNKPKKPRSRKCANASCRQWFSPKEHGIVVCSEECAVLNAKHSWAKEKMRSKRKAKQEYNKNDKSNLIKIAQKEINRYVRLRDKGSPCISCGAINYRQEAGHYKSAGGHGSIRFNTLNIWSQCHKCNVYLSANLVNYRENLIKKIGVDKVDWLESQNAPRKYTIEYLHKLIMVFRKKIKLMESRA